MPQVVSVTHQNIVRHCRIPAEWEMPAVGADQRLLVVNIRAIQAAFAHAASEMHHEIGGYITGYPAYDDVRGIAFIYVDKVVRGMYESTPTHVTLLAQGYFAAHTLCSADNTFVIGWYHSHPRLTVFFSGTDHHNHHQNFVRPHEIAMVVDPAQGNVPDTGDIATVRSALNQRNFALFTWNRTVDKVVRVHHPVLYVESAPQEVAVESSAEVSQDDTRGVPVTVSWDESVYAQVLQVVTSGLADGARMGFIGETYPQTAIRQVWFTDQPRLDYDPTSQIVGLLIHADDEAAATLCAPDSLQQVRDVLGAVCGAESMAVAFPFHLYLFDSAACRHVIICVRDELHCEVLDGEPLQGMIRAIPEAGNE